MRILPHSHPHQVTRIPATGRAPRRWPTRSGACSWCPSRCGEHLFSLVLICVFGSVMLVLFLFIAVLWLKILHNTVHSAGPSRTVWANKPPDSVYPYKKTHPHFHTAGTPSQRCSASLSSAPRMTSCSTLRTASRSWTCWRATSSC